MKGKEKMVSSSGVRQCRPLVKKQTIKSSEEVQVVEKKSEAGRASNAATTGKVVIIEEEYQLLLTLKKKVEAMTLGKWDDPHDVHRSH